jgi:hypothetical protein
LASAELANLTHLPWRSLTFGIALAAACAASLAACKTRQFNKPAGSSAKSGADLKAKALSRTSDLPPEEDLQEQNDLVRLTDGSLSQDFAPISQCVVTIRSRGAISAL